MAAIVSETAPPPQAVEGVLWVQPSAKSPGTAESVAFDAEVIREQASGEPIGLSADGQTFHVPEIVGAIPVVIGGKRYLVPILEE
jgi:hypothetical protein